MTSIQKAIRAYQARAQELKRLELHDANRHLRAQFRRRQENLNVTARDQSFDLALGQGRR